MLGYVKCANWEVIIEIRTYWVTVLFSSVELREYFSHETCDDSLCVKLQKEQFKQATFATADICNYNHLFSHFYCSCPHASL